MIKAFAHLWYEALSALEFDPFLTAWSVGFCIVDIDGQVRITASGAEYMEDYLRRQDQ